MAKRANISAGLLLYRRTGNMLEVLLAHPGGPFWAKKDLGAWSIPKGEIDPGEESDPLLVARREFAEETGQPIAGDFVPLTPVRQRGGKIVQAWAIESDFDVSQLRLVASERLADLMREDDDAARMVPGVFVGRRKDLAEEDGGPAIGA